MLLGASSAQSIVIRDRNLMMTLDTTTILVHVVEDEVVAVTIHILGAGANLDIILAFSLLSRIHVVHLITASACMCA